MTITVEGLAHLQSELLKARSEALMERARCNEQRALVEHLTAELESLRSPQPPVAGPVEGSAIDKMLADDANGFKLTWQEAADLCAEVRRLRGENERLIRRPLASMFCRAEEERDAAMADRDRLAQQVGELQAKLARVEALPQRWLERAASEDDSDYGRAAGAVGMECVRELESALRDADLHPAPVAVY